MSTNIQKRPLEQQTRRVLFETVGINVVDFCCAAPVEPTGPEEPNPTHSIVFIRSGIFGRIVHRHTLVADANHVLFFNAAQLYRFSHPVCGGDECTILTITTSAALELVAGHQPRDAERSERPFVLGHGLVSRRAGCLHYELLALLKRSASKVEIEDVLTELADQAIDVAYQTHHRQQDRPTPAGNRQRRDMVEATKIAINRRMDSIPSLGELARSVGCSPFHLSRIFHEVTGLTLRRYVARLRTLAAAERLADGAADLTDLALDLGYSDHSHFTNAFRQEWGLAPSRFRARHSSPRQPVAHD